MDKTVAIMIGSIIALAGLLFAIHCSDPSRVGSEQHKPVTLFCAASNRAVMEAIRQQYADQTQRIVFVQYGPSQTLLSAIAVAGDCDLFLPADDSYLQIGRDKNLIDEVLPIAQMHGVVAVKRGNPKGIHKFQDLLRDDVRFVQANPDAAAIGKVTRRALQDAGLWEAFNQHCVGDRGTVTEVANDILIGAADAGIVYDAVLHTYPDLEFIRLPELESTTSNVSIGVVTRSKNSAAALHFARYIAAADRGLVQYKKHGFTVGPP